MFDLSLSLVFLRCYDLDVSRALLLYLDPMMFLPLLLSCNELSFPFEVILSDSVFKDLRTLDVYPVMHICGDNRIPRDSLDVCFGDQLAGSAHEPMHRGWHTFSS